MRQLILLIFSVLSFQLSSSQINELGVFLGGSNFIGDIGATDYIAPNQLAIGGIYKWNRSRRHSYRLSLIFSELEALDKDSDDPRRIIRGYESSSKIVEFSLGMEFTFLEFNLHSHKNIGTPYLFSGITVTSQFDNVFEGDGRIIENNKSNLVVGIPMVIGYKASFLRNFLIGIEIGARYNFRDDLDGNVSGLNIGNVNNNDWYMVSGITLTYTFGENPCYCVN